MMQFQWINQEVLENFVDDCYRFNQVAGKHNKVSLQDIRKQCELIKEEAQETMDAASLNNPTEVLDGVVDVLVTAFGLLQKLQEAGFDVSTALEDTAINNMTKYPLQETTARMTVDYYARKGEDVQVSFDEVSELYVIKNKNGKVMKPVGFVPNDLSGCVPEEFKKGFV